MTPAERKADPKKTISLMRRRFLPDRCAGWDTTIHIFLSDAGNITVNVDGGALEILAGLKGKPVARIATDTKTLAAVLAGKRQFDLAVVQGDFNTDNMIEAFKFVTVFEPDAYGGELTATSAAKDGSPILAGKKEAVAFLTKWAVRAVKDPSVRVRAAESGLKGSLAIRAANPDFVLSFGVSQDGFTIKCRPSAKSADLDMEAVNIHKILCGAQNLMIGLNRKSVGVPKGSSAGEILDLLIYIQPTLSRIYREMI
ncbi:MAG: hypothetical protein WCX65_10985 [bacterium]